MFLDAVWHLLFREKTALETNSIAHISFNFCYLDLKFCMQIPIAVVFELKKKSDIVTLAFRNTLSLLAPPGLSHLTSV